MFVKINSYLFIDNLYKDIEKKIKKFKNLSIVYNYSNENNIKYQDIKTLNNYCKKNRIKFFIKSESNFDCEFSVFVKRKINIKTLNFINQNSQLIIHN
jgi:ABC-type Zn uptake system ZnuABC Zn-binding protein ZnuA